MSVDLLLMEKEGWLRRVGRYKFPRGGWKTACWLWRNRVILENHAWRSDVGVGSHFRRKPWAVWVLGILFVICLVCLWRYLSALAACRGATVFWTSTAFQISPSLVCFCMLLASSSISGLWTFPASFPEPRPFGWSGETVDKPVSTLKVNWGVVVSLC